SEGIETFFLEVRRTNEAALELYLKFGFYPLGISRAYYSDTGEDAIVMKLDCRNPRQAPRVETKGCVDGGVIVRGEIVLHEQVGPAHMRMGIDAPEIVEQCAPGRFVMVGVGNGHDPLLKRPLALYWRRGSVVELLYRIVGRGTAGIALMRTGEEVDLLGPFGNGFDCSEVESAILVAGGMGIASMPLLAQALSQKGVPARLLYGVRDKRELVGLGPFDEMGFEHATITEVGSQEPTGLVTDLLEQALVGRRDPGRGLTCFACGPEPMLREVAKVSAEAGVACQVSLERRMACGFGVCLGCVVAVADGGKYRKVCTDGPVFHAEEVQW
ncbi:hypothetical protein ACFL4G_13385, partial [Thermodesulfobacteriota bacterium]